MTRDDIIRMARKAGYTGLNDPWLHTFAALVAALEQKPKFTLSCGCPSQYGGAPAEWPKTDREGNPAVAYGVVCERHWHEYEARCPNCASLEAQNTELDRKLASLEQPKPPPEAQTEAERLAYCAGWWAAMEQKREQPAQEPVALFDARLRAWRG
jgi:hypothetical protein